MISKRNSRSSGTRKPDSLLCRASWIIGRRRIRSASRQRDWAATGPVAQPRPRRSDRAGPLIAAQLERGAVIRSMRLDKHKVGLSAL
jgi:hypothetical protein